MKYNLIHQHYMNAIELSEQNSNLYEQIKSFFASQDRTIIREISAGITMIPSPASLQKSLDSLLQLNLQQNTIALYKKCISLSEQFYNEIIESIVKARINEFSYNKHFNNITRIYGIEFISEFDKLGRQINTYYQSPSRIFLNTQSKYLLIFSTCFLFILLISLELYQEVIGYAYISALLILLTARTKNLNNIVLGFKKNNIYGHNILGHKYRIHLNNIVQKYYHTTSHRSYYITLTGTKLSCRIKDYI